MPVRCTAGCRRGLPFENHARAAGLSREVDRRETRRGEGEGDWVASLYLLRADLLRADLLRADLLRADLLRADLLRADLLRADLLRADPITLTLVASRLDLSRSRGRGL
jgi:hypothetical protein